MDSPELRACDAVEPMGFVYENAEDSVSDVELEESECSVYSENSEGRMETESEDSEETESEDSVRRTMTESDNWDSEDSECLRGFGGADDDGVGRLGLGGLGV